MTLKMNVMLYVFSCTQYDTLRNNFFDETINKYLFFNDLDVESKICSYLTILIHRHYHVISKVNSPISELINYFLESR